jgi:cytochrome b561
MSPTKIELFLWHKSTGMLILALVALRLLWRLANPTPALPSGMAAWERTAARLSHVLLYALMIALPITGWIVNSASNIPFRIFWMIPLPAIVAPDKSTADAVALVHGGLAALLALVLAAHIGAALRHHFVKRNNVLTRMLPGTESKP